MNSFDSELWIEQYEEDELIKQGDLEMSEDIIQEQPTITNQREM